MKTKLTRSNRIGELVTKLRRTIADYLNSKVNELPQPVKKLAFLLAGIMIAILCFRLIFQSMNGEKVNDDYSIDQLTVPYDIQPRSQPSDSISGH